MRGFLGRAVPLLLASAVAGLAPPAGRAAVNPLSPGLPPANAYGKTGIPNNGASAMCVECHTVNPRPSAGTHFVANLGGDGLRRTNSGGGWPLGFWGIRDDGQFMKLTAWGVDAGGSGALSKYGDLDAGASVVHAASADGRVAGVPGVRVETNTRNMAGLDLICESCHNVLTNTGTRAYLVSRLTDQAVEPPPPPPAESEASESPPPPAPPPTPAVDGLDGAVADLCVGCHGFLFHDDGGTANRTSRHWSDPRNFDDVTGRRRGNNEKHYINGVVFPRNHHVMTGDAVDEEHAEAGLLMRDVSILDTNSVSVPIRTDANRPGMRMKRPAVLPIVLPKGVRSLHCLTCHSAGHGGDPSMGAAILRGVDLKGRDKGGRIDRIVDGREWGRYSDATFCQYCHSH